MVTQQAAGSEITDAFLAAHASLHPAGAEISALMQEGVTQGAILALYPFDFADWCPQVIEQLNAGGAGARAELTRTLAAGESENRWLDITMFIPPRSDSLVISAGKRFMKTHAAAELFAAVAPTKKSSAAVQYIHRQVLQHACEILTVAANWHLFPELHSGDWHLEYKIVLGRALRSLGAVTDLGVEPVIDELKVELDR